MRSIALPAAFGAVLYALTSLPAEGATWAALAVLPAAIVLAVLASDGPGALAVCAGALGAAACVALSPTQPELAGGALVLAAYLPRIVRVRRLEQRTLTLGLAGGLGVAAAAVATRFADAAPLPALAAAVVAGVLASVARLVPAEDRITHALRGLADRVPDPCRTRLIRAAALRAETRALASTAALRVDDSFASLLTAARARATAAGPSSALLDRAVAEHLAAIEQIAAAALEADARATLLADPALLASRAEGESLAAHAAALAEVTDPQPADVAKHGAAG